MKINLFLLGLFLSISGNAQEFSNQVKTFISDSIPSFAITKVHLIDGTGTALKSNQTIVIKEGIITAIGNADEISTTGLRVIDGSVKTVIPGFVMLHEHMFYSKPFENWFSVGQMTFSFPRLYLAGGVTSMRTAGSIQPQTDLNVKRWVEMGRMTGPKMHVTGPFIEREGTMVPELGFIATSEDVSKMVNYWADQGITSFKVYQNITKEDLRICVEEAHKRGLKVTGHLCSITYEEASNIGIDNLEHGFFASSDLVENKEDDLCDPFSRNRSRLAADVDDERMTRLMDLLIKNKTAITTTPVVFEPYTDREIVPGGGFEALAPQIQESVKANYDRRVGRDNNSLKLFEKDLIWLKQFYDKGGHLVVGTDPTGAGRTVAGYANMRTLEILVEAGFTLEDAVKICTWDGAKLLEVDNETGTIEVGKQADLLLIDGDLRTDIKNIRQLQTIYKDGIGFDSKKLFDSVRGLVGLN
jgi:imidazolonepropionase-like amidohydrolase